jgi:HK97 gp10 family phage protein
MKISRNGVEFTSNIDAVNYTIKELTRAALRDVARYLRYETTKKIRKLPGISSKRARNSTGYWLRKQEGDLVIGIKVGKNDGTWYGAQQELGEHNQPKREFLRGTVFENIDKIREIESQYLSAINDENPDLSVINEEEGTDADDRD